MRSLKILHCADIHIDAPFRFFGAKGEDQRLQVRKTFESICSMAHNDEYDLLLIAGDLFDSNIVSERTVRWAAGRLEAAGLPVCICPGNHDFVEDGCVYIRYKTIWPENVFIFSDPSVTTCDLPSLDVTVHARPIFSSRSSASALEGIRRKGDARWHIGMAHGSVVIPGRIEDVDAPIPRDDIESSCLDYVALGHWHTWGDYSTRHVKAVYPGSPERLDFSGGPGCIAAVTLAHSGVSVRALEVGKRSMSEQSISATGITDVNEVIKEIVLHADPHLALRVILEGMCEVGLQLDTEAVESELAERFFFLTIDDRSHPSLTDVDEGLFPEKLVIGKYVRRMKARIEEVAGDEEAVSTLEEALRLGVALLQGRRVM